MSVEYMRQGARLAALVRKAALYRVDGPRRTNGWGSWYQTVFVGERKYFVGVEPGRRVRIAFKPAGTYGRRWHGLVNDARGQRVWSAEVRRSAGVFSLLCDAGLLPELDVAYAIVDWGQRIRDTYGGGGT